MRFLYAAMFSIAIFGLAQTSASGQGKTPESAPPPAKALPKDAGGICFNCPKQSFKHLDGHRLVFVVNGVANGTAASDTLIELNSELCLGLKISPVSWCRYDSTLKDLVDQEAQINAAARIACQVTLIRKDAPNAKIYFVGHSAGTRVVLAAAEMLPPKSVERVILLASAVSCTYDLTTALKTSRLGIDNFWSSEDGTLDHGVEHVGTADGLRTHAAGKVGFRLASSDRKDIEAYRALRQYRWNEDLHGSGGHFSWTRYHNAKKCIVPLFFFEPPVVLPPVTIKVAPK